MEKIALKVRDAAAAIGVSERFLWERLKSGEIPSSRAGRVRLVEVEQLKAFVSKHREEVAAKQAS